MSGKREKARRKAARTCQHEVDLDKSRHAATAEFVKCALCGVKFRALRPARPLRPDEAGRYRPREPKTAAVGATAAANALI